MAKSDSIQPPTGEVLVKLGPPLPEAGGVNAADFAHEVRWFYDRAILAALGGVLSQPWIPGGLEPSEAAAIHARALTERRFGVRLILPGDGE